MKLGLQNYLRKLPKPSASAPGVVTQQPAQADKTAYAAPAAGATAVTSAAAGDFTALANDHAALVTAHNALLAKLRAAGIIA